MSTRLPSLILPALLFVACAAPPSEELDPPTMLSPGGKSDGPFDEGPMYLTGAFDGSRAFGMWVDTIAFARSFARETGKALHFTYFINTAYYDPAVRGSVIGTAATKAEGRLRWALTQQALNEGHEIANHTVRHKDGSAWSFDAWRQELHEVDAAVAQNLFEPVLGADGKPLFPRWRAAPGARAGAVGAACTAADQCTQRSCAMVTPEQGFCTKACSSDAQCGTGMACGGICLPLPEAPIFDEQGETLFDRDGNANLVHRRMRPYRMTGFRAPQLGMNHAMFKALVDLGYRYDTTQILAPGAPTRARQSGETFRTLYEFALMKHPGTRTIPMDYNYLANDVDPARMLSDYKLSIVRQYEQVGRAPWNIGHHFSLWKSGGYWNAMKDAFRYAAAGCLENGRKRCPDVAFPTFAELADELDGLNGKADGQELFAPSDESALDGAEGEHVPESCEEEQAPTHQRGGHR
jgi:hypothetical protein